LVFAASHATGAVNELRIITLTDGGQRAEDVAREVVAFVEPAQRTLDLALYDVRLPGAVGDEVRDAIRAAARRGVEVRLAYNQDHSNPIPVPPPPATRPEILDELGIPLRAIPGEPDLMHHKYVIRDSGAVWTGSLNWTLDSWTRQENVVAVVTDSGVAHAFTQDFEQLWRTGVVQDTGAFDAPRAAVRPWFCPGRGEALSARIAAALSAARRRIRIASPVLTASPVLATLAEVCSTGVVDVAGVVDGTQMEQVYDQWHANGNAAWKLPLIERVFERAPFAGKRSTPYGPGTLHDYMHAKVTIADDTVFVGSFNLSHSGEQNAENVLETTDSALAEELAGFVDQVRAGYPRAPLPTSKP
jgi:phosphatidylserine/phosphatidylglycerophosphate/cardiolipin synthase-like enzyme